MSSTMAPPTAIPTEPPFGNSDDRREGHGETAGGKIDVKRTGIYEACQTVKAILDQVTLNDSPPVNEEAGPGLSPTASSFSKDRSVVKSRRQRRSQKTSRTAEPRKYSRQRHVLPQNNEHGRRASEPPTLSPAASSVSDLSSNLSTNWELHSVSRLSLASRSHQHDLQGSTSASFVQDHHDATHNQAEMRLGHVALVTLCSRTLDSINQVTAPVSKKKSTVSLTHLMSTSPVLNQTALTGTTTSESSSVESGVREPPTPKDPSPRNASATSPSNRSWEVRWKKRPEEALGELSNAQVAQRAQNSPRRRGKDVDAPNLSRLTVEIQDVFSPQIERPTPSRGNQNKVDERTMSQVASDDSTDAVCTPNDSYHESSYDDTAHPPQREEYGNGEYDPDNLALYASSSSTEMEGIMEESAADVAAERSADLSHGQIFDHPQNVSPLSVRLPSNPQRLQMFGSEYARFLSPTVLGPETRVKHTGRRKSTRRYFRSGAGSRVANRRSRNIEEASSATLTGAITDILVTHGSEIPPKGFYRISQTGEGDNMTALHHGGIAPGRRTTQVYINVKKEANWDRAAQRPCVTALAIVFPGRREVVPPGFCVVRHYRGKSQEDRDTAMPKDSSSSMAANLNFGSSGERVFLCYRRSREGNPITGIIPLQPSNNEMIPEGYTVIERSPREHVADLNSGVGPPLFLGFRQRLANLETLRPMPLLLSVLYSNRFGAAEESGPLLNLSSRNRHRRRLRAYYCTGGTVVPSDVGQFHIMDRSTHSMLSPSSIANRLEMIEEARKRATTNVPKRKPNENRYASSSDLYAGELDDGSSLNDSFASNASSSIHLSRNGHSVSTDSDIMPEGSSHTDSSQDHSLVQSFSTLSHQTPVRDEDISNGNAHDQSTGSLMSSSGAANVETLFSAHNHELQECLIALNFIPRVESGQLNINREESVLQQARIAALTPILTACYTHHGGSSIVAVDGLTKLLMETEFFLPDITRDNALDEENSRLTLLDLATQAVCDVAMSSARETSFGGCVEFVQNALRYAGGHLSDRTIGYVLRFYLFVFYVGASVPTSSKSRTLVWTTDYKEQQDPLGMRSTVARDDVPLLHEPSEHSNLVGANSYLPGGAPQASALALKELLSLTLGRLDKTKKYSATERKGDRHKSGIETVQSSQFGTFIQCIVSELIDSTVHRVDMANYTQLALHQIHRSGGSELFWYDMMTSCGNGLFGNIQGVDKERKDVYIVSFVLLANLVKVSCGRIRCIPHSLDLAPRDIASKILSLELLHHFLASWNAETIQLTKKDRQTEAVETMAFAVRRLVAPCLLSNTMPGLEDDRVFRRIIRIISELWRSHLFRNHMKIELGVLMSHFAIDLLKLGPQLRPPQIISDLERGVVDPALSASPLRGVRSPLVSQQIDVLFEMGRWFNPDSTDVVQAFLNFDTPIAFDDSGSGQFLPESLVKLTERLCGVICTIAEQAGDVICEQIRSSQMSNSVPPPSPSTVSQSRPINHALSPSQGSSETTYLREVARHLQLEAFEAITQLIKSLANSAAISAGIPFRPDLGLSADSFRPGGTENEIDPIPVVSWQDGRNRNRRLRHDGRSSPAHSMLDCHSSGTDDQTIQDYWQLTAERHSAKRSPRPPPRQSQRTQAPVKAVESSRVRYLRSSSESRSSSSTYDESTLATALEISRSKNLRKAIDYLIACDFLTPSSRDIAAFLRAHGGRIEPRVLGVYLGEGGTDGADTEHWNSIRFNFVRATSFVGMNVEEGLRHFLTNSGFRLPGEAQMIDRLISTFAQCFWEDNAGDRYRCPFGDQDTVYLVSFAIIMLNTDLHKTHKGSRHQKKRMTKTEFVNNLRGVDNGEELSRDYLSVIFDSIEADPIELLDDIEPATPKGEAASLRSMLRDAKASEELLRGLSVHEHSFYAIDDFGRSVGYDPHGRGALQDLSRSAFAAIWHHVHGLVHTTLDAAHADPRGMVASLELIKTALYVTICLDMSMERTAFMVQLARFKAFAERRGDWRVSHEQEGYKLEEWYGKLTRACDEAEEESKLSALVQVNKIILDLSQSLAINVEVKKEMTRVVRRLRDGEFLLNDPTRAFLREGELQKRGNRLGRTSRCYFFLFSDVLIYAKDSPLGEEDFKIHEELPLHLMKVTDWFPEKKHYSKCAFQIHHPRKSLIVTAASLEERQRWVKDIRGAITEEMSRLAQLEHARVAASSLERYEMTLE